MSTHGSLIDNECVVPGLRPVSRRTIGDDVLERLRQAIIGGVFAPGDHLAEGTLAAKLGVSRAPVREAMMQLEREGLLVFDRRGAALVKVFTDADFEEIFSLRLTLEVLGARLASRRLSDGDFARLEVNLQETQRVERLVDLALLDVAFHDLVMQGSGHARLQACWALVRHQLEFWLALMHNRVATPVEKAREGTVRHHSALVALLRTRREERVARAFQEHIEGWRDQLAKSDAMPPKVRRTVVR